MVILFPILDLPYDYTCFDRTTRSKMMVTFTKRSLRLLMMFLTKLIITKYYKNKSYSSIMFG